MRSKISHRCTSYRQSRRRTEPQGRWSGIFIVEPPIVRINIHGQKIVLSHYPLMKWQSMSRGSWHLHGHIHSAGSVYNELNRKQGLMRYDVGVDANDLAPVSLDAIRAWFEGVEFYGRARWWEWVNGTGDPAVARGLRGGS